MSLEATPRFRDLLFGDSLRSCPGFDCRLAIVGDRPLDHPAGNGVRWRGDLQRHNQYDREGHLPSMTLTPSQIAPTKPVTITVITALCVLDALAPTPQVLEICAQTRPPDSTHQGLSVGRARPSFQASGQWPWLPHEVHWPAIGLRSPVPGPCRLRKAR